MSKSVIDFSIVHLFCIENRYFKDIEHVRAEVAPSKCTKHSGDLTFIIGGGPDKKKGVYEKSL